MGKRKNPSHYNRQTSQYKKNIYRGELKKAGVKPPKFRNNPLFKKVIFALGIAWALAAIAAIFISRHLALGLLLVGVIGVAGVVAYVNYEDKKLIRAYIKIGLSQEDFNDALIKRGVDSRQIARINKLWDKVEKKEKAKE